MHLLFSSKKDTSPPSLSSSLLPSLSLLFLLFSSFFSLSSYLSISISLSICLFLPCPPKEGPVLFLPCDVLEIKTEMRTVLASS
jgi:hypothetical protein